MKVHPLQRTDRMNRFCGPAVVSMLGNITTNEAAAMFRAVSGKDKIRGTHTRHMVMVLRRLRIRPVLTYAPRKSDALTLAQWLRQNAAERKAGVVFLIAAGHHWQLVTGRRYACGRVDGLVSLKDKRIKKRARVESVHRLELLP